jgi:hypothetical protein
MTEQEWLTSTDPTAMLRYVLPRGEESGLAKERRPSSRKLRLFACACSRQVWDLLTDEHSRAAVEVAERFADGLATEEELAAAKAESWGVPAALGHSLESFRPLLDGTTNWPAVMEALTASRAAWKFASQAAPAASGVWCDPFGNPFRAASGARQAVLLRDLFGNPFRPVRMWARGDDGRGLFLLPEITWLTRTVIDLAQTIYDDRHFEDLPVLVDALEEAGCTDEALLLHLRGPGPHVRGCWALDLILGKE